MPITQSPRPTQADLSVLGPLAEHPVLITPQVAVLLGVSQDAAGRRLRRLRAAGLVSYGVIYSHGPGIASITAGGQRALGRHGTTAPGFNPTEYRHDVGVAWLWLAARAGVFGRLDGILTEQTMIAADRSGTLSGRSPGAAGTGRETETAAHGLGLGTFGRYGSPSRHYPDLLLSTSTGHQVAMELELTAKSRPRMNQIMTAYATDPRIDLVVYLVPSAAVARTVSEAARRAGISGMVQVRRLAPQAIEGADGVGPLRRSDAVPTAAEPRASRAQTDSPQVRRRASTHPGPGRASTHQGDGRASTHPGPGHGSTHQGDGLER